MRTRCNCTLARSPRRTRLAHRGALRFRQNLPHPRVDPRRMAVALGRTNPGGTATPRRKLVGVPPVISTSRNRPSRIFPKPAISPVACSSPPNGNASSASLIPGTGPRSLRALREAGGGSFPKFTPDLGFPPWFVPGGRLLGRLLGAVTRSPSWGIGWVAQYSCVKFPPGTFRLTTPTRRPLPGRSTGNCRLPVPF